MHVAALPLVPLLPGEFAPVPAEAAFGEPLTPLVPLVAFALPVPLAPFAPVPVPVAPGDPLAALVPLVAFALPEPYPRRKRLFPRRRRRRASKGQVTSRCISRYSLKSLASLLALVRHQSPRTPRGSGGGGKAFLYFWTRNLVGR
jgi:hypothetical protein